MANKQILRCFLCGKVESEVEHLIKGKFGCVCDGCIQDAYDVLNEEEEEQITHNIQLATANVIFASS